VFYVSIRRTEDFEFDIIRTAGVSGNATNYEKSQGDNAVCSTRDEISQPSRPISPRAATDNDFGYIVTSPKAGAGLTLGEPGNVRDLAPKL